jgi:hypothetical protein
MNDLRWMINDLWFMNELFIIDDWMSDAWMVIEGCVHDWRMDFFIYEFFFDEWWKLIK